MDTTVRGKGLVVDDERRVLAVLLAGWPRTLPRLAGNFPEWDRSRLELALAAAWADGSVSIDADDAFVALGTG